MLSIGFATCIHTELLHIIIILVDWQSPPGALCYVIDCWKRYRYTCAVVSLAPSSLLNWRSKWWCYEFMMTVMVRGFLNFSTQTSNNKSILLITKNYSKKLINSVSVTCSIRDSCMQSSQGLGLQVFWQITSILLAIFTYWLFQKKTAHIQYSFSATFRAHFIRFSELSSTLVDMHFGSLVLNRAQLCRFGRSGVARLEVMEGQTPLTCIPRKTLDNVNDHTKG